jgi:hypothetical protein
VSHPTSSKSEIACRCVCVLRHARISVRAIAPVETRRHVCTPVMASVETVVRQSRLGRSVETVFVVARAAVVETVHACCGSHWCESQSTSGSGATPTCEARQHQPWLESHGTSGSGATPTCEARQHQPWRESHGTSGSGSKAAIVCVFAPAGRAMVCSLVCGDGSESRHAHGPLTLGEVLCA